MERNELTADAQVEYEVRRRIAEALGESMDDVGVVVGSGLVLVKVSGFASIYDAAKGVYPLLGEKQQIIQQVVEGMDLGMVVVL